MKRITSLFLVLVVLISFTVAYATTYQVTTEQTGLYAHEPGTKEVLATLPKDSFIDGYEKNGQVYFKLPDGRTAYAWIGHLTKVDGDVEYDYPCDNPSLPPSVGGGAHWGEGLEIGMKVEAKTTNGINIVVRKGPAFSYAENGHVKLGEVVTITAIAEDGQWIQIQRAHQTSPCGWVWYQTLDPVEPVEEVATPQMEEIPEECTDASVELDGAYPASNPVDASPAPTEGAHWGKGLVKGGNAKVKTSNGDSLNVRGGPGRDFGIVTYLAPGTVVEVISEYGNWTCVGEPGGWKIYGYVWTECLDPVK